MRRLPAVVLLGIAVVFAIPFLWLVLAAFDPVASLSIALPERWSLANFRLVLGDNIVQRPLAVSFVMSAGAGLLTLALAIPAAYALSRYRHRRLILDAILFGSCLPITAIMVPVFAMFVQLRLVDSIAATTVFLTAAALPMAIYLAKSFVDAVPVELEQAAWVDGASRLVALRTIVVPLMGPGLVALFLFTFIGVWGNFFVPFILLSSPDKHPAAVRIFAFFGQYGTVSYGQLAAFSILFSTPVLLLYALAERLMKR